MVTRKDNFVVVHETMGAIGDRILKHRLLKQLRNASSEEIVILKKKFGADTVSVGIDIIEAYDMLNNIINEVNTIS